MPPNPSTLSPVVAALPLPDGPALRCRAPLRAPSRIPSAVSLALVLLAGSPVFAGDILRGGAPAGKRAGKGSDNPINAAAQQAKLNAKDALARTTRAMLAVKSMQDAARAAAIAGPNNLGQNPNRPGQTLPSVPDGLTKGGLQVAPGVPKNLASPQTGEDASLWRGALLPKQKKSDGQTVVTIDQLKPQAILNWETFNVGKKTTVEFNQSRGGTDKSQWTAFNKINDPSGAPSQILGKIEAPGQVYLINPNGILFGGSSQINLHGLVASSLPINDNLIARGLLNNPSAEFLFSAPQASGGTLSLPAFTPIVTSYTLGGESAPKSVKVTVDGRVLRENTHYTTAVFGGKTVVTFKENAYEQYAEKRVMISYVDQSTGSSVTDSAFTLPPFVPRAAVTSTLAQNAVQGGVVVTTTGASKTKLTPGVHFTTSRDAAGKTVVTLTKAGLQKFSSQQLAVSYFTAQGGDVVVQKGAQLSSPTNSANVGGRITLVAPNARNEGTISTPDGQTFIAAGLQVGFAAHPSSDPALRGLDVYVGEEGTLTGKAINSGIISTPRANVTIAGKDVQQLGVVDSTTSVTLNGSVNLLANFGVRSVQPQGGNAFFSTTETGNVTIGQDSVTQILPELSSGKQVVGTELSLRSRMTIQGRNIQLEDNSTLLAPNASISLSAGVWLPVGETRQFISSTGQIHLGAGAMINVAGTTDVEVAIAQNILSLELRGAELADSPLQRGGPLRGPTLNLDIRQRGVYNGREWVGTPLGDASGYVGLIERGVGELTTAGGDVTFTAGDSVVMQAGAKVDVSGGYITFQEGMVSTTRVVSDGRIVDIANATPDREFTGIYDGTYTRMHPKYGIQRKWANPLMLSGEHFEPTYIDGKSGGSIAISAASMALDGELLGQTVTGPRQRTAQTAPRHSALSLSFEQQDANVLNYQKYSPTPPTVTFGTGVSMPAGEFRVDSTGAARGLRAERIANVNLSPDLFTVAGFGSITINNPDGEFILPKETKLKLPARGSLTVSASNVALQGTIAAPNGTLAFTAYNFTPYHDHEFPDGVRTTPDVHPSRGSIVLGPNASLNVAGLIVDDRPTSAAPVSLPLATDGGSISLAGYNVRLAQGSLLDASGGVALARDGKRTFGAGGSISIKAGNDPKAPQIIGGRLDLGGELRAFSGAKGGSLTIQAPVVQIGGQTPGTVDTLLLSPTFFTKGGFTEYNLIGLGEKVQGESFGFTPAVQILPGTVIKPVAETWTALSYSQLTGGAQLMSTLQPEGVRAPASISFSALGVLDSFQNNRLVLRGDIVMGESARIETDARANVSFSGETVTMLGSVYAPGGSITIADRGSSNIANAFGISDRSLTTVYLGPTAHLSTKGKVLYTPNIFCLRTGTVLPGGRISVSGNIVAEAGAVLDVSGASGILDLPITSVVAGGLGGNAVVPAESGVNSPLYSQNVVPTLVESDAGSIVLAGGQQLFVDAELRGGAGGPSALGGSLTVSSGRFYPPLSAPKNPLDITLQVTQSGSTIPQIEKINGTAVGQSVRGLEGAVLPGFGRFAVSSFEKGGFDSLTLRGTVEFLGPVSLDARRTLSVADAGVIYANDAVTLKAPYITLGTPFLPPLQASQVKPPFEDGAGNPYYFKPTHGPGSLTVIADLIDIGNLSLQNIGAANFIADGGDIRGDGTLDVAGSIYMRAAQVYPPTAVTFTIAASDYKVGEETLPGSVTIEGFGTRQLPLSAGGQLNIFGSVIEQRGTVRAPLGGITIGWDGTGEARKNPITNEAVAATQTLTLAPGSLTSVSAVPLDGGAPLVIPFGLTVNGVTWIDPSGRDITAGGVAQKTINLAAQNINSMAGSKIDIQGGGDLYAYRWVQGIGGTKDILASTTSFAVIPGYGSNYAPYAPFNPAPPTPSLNGDPGYVNSSLKVGDQIHLEGIPGLPAGEYTLLPARYALMPGAFLVTPKSGAAIGTLSLPDGSVLTPGYRYNNLNAQRTLNPQFSWFEVLSPTAIRDRAEYADYYGNEFLFVGARANESLVPRLPRDAGHLTLQATTSMVLEGTVAAQAPKRSRGGMVDIGSPTDIVITANGGSIAGKLVLDAGQLSSFGAESLLIGGIRNQNGNISTISVKTNNLTLDNAGTPLRGPEIILVAKEDLTLAAGASIVQDGKIAGHADTLVIGSASTPGSGDGALIRVTGDSSAQLSRLGRSTTGTPMMTIGAGASITGTSVTLDSTFGTALDSSARIDADRIALNSGQISIQLDNPGALNPTQGLVLSGAALQSLESSKSLSLLSYSTLDFYGTGSFDVAGQLALHAAQIRGYNHGDGIVSVSASSLRIDNVAKATATGTPGGATGTLEFSAGIIGLGQNAVAIQQFGTVELNASRGIIGVGAGELSVQRDLLATSPVITANRSATQTIRAGGLLSFSSDGAGGVNGGLGASLTLEGATVSISSDIVLPSGQLTVRATNGDVTIDGGVRLNGTAQALYDLIRYTGGGHARFISESGSVNIGADSVISVSAHAGGGNAGSLSISARNGAFNSLGEFVGRGGEGGLGGEFTLDTGTLSNFSGIESALDAGGFNHSQEFRVHSGDVVINGTARAHNFRLSTDLGSITVGSTGIIDASGARGGTINLAAGGSVVLMDGARLTAAAEDFDAAGKGGAIYLETRGLNGGTVDIRSGSTIDLGVASNTSSSAAFGKFTGALHLRAPQNAASNDFALSTIGGNIVGASVIIAEGYRVFDLTVSSRTITTAVQQQVLQNGNTFMGAGYNAMFARVSGGNASLESLLSLRPGAEIVNTTNGLTLGNANSTYTSDWNLATYRFGPRNAPGVLTLRAAGDIRLFNTISDGFQTAAWNSVLLQQNTQMPVNAQSWDLRFTAGADFSAADTAEVRSLSSLGAGMGSLILGKDRGVITVNPTGSGQNAPTTANAIAGGAYQVIRTGSGDITINAGRDVQFRTEFASIYTAGTQVLDATVLPNGGSFDLPNTNTAAPGVIPNLGLTQRDPILPAQYSVAGGNVSIFAQNDIARVRRLPNGTLVSDSSREMPTSWLYRRGLAGADGEYIAGRIAGSIDTTTWWVDFSNFFEGVGTLGGGNISLVADRDIANVDAAAPTNARAPIGAADPERILELGGGDILVRAGRDIDAGVYYVERGHGTLDAGGAIKTNGTRSPNLGALTNAQPTAAETWLPTTLFLGKGSFDLTARGDLLLGPVANPFLLPGAYNNTVYYKSYFSTYAPDSAVNISSLSGNVTMRLATSPVTDAAADPLPILQTWYQKQMQYGQTASAYSAANYQPWLLLNETSVAPFSTAFSLLPATVRLNAFAGDVNILGRMNLAPAPTGTVEIAAARSVNGLNIVGRNTIGGTPTFVWAPGTINLSDALPASVPSAADPLGYLNTLAPGASFTLTSATFLSAFDELFEETGSTRAVLETKQALHAPGLLHSGDTSPARIYAGTGDVTGLTLYSPKASKVIAGRDVTDVALYLQNLEDKDISIVAAGRDIVAYNANTSRRVIATSQGNALSINSLPLAGDLQMAGPGTLEVLAGRNIDLGSGVINADGTGAGIASIGNARNPYLPFAGASLVIGAGIGPSMGLDASDLDFTQFVSSFVASAAGDRYKAELAEILGGTGDATDFDALDPAQQRLAALNIFYLMLRDAGRDHNDESSAGFGNYEGGFAAIASLFPGADWKGDISMTSRQIKTQSGGSISMFAPGGKIVVGFDAGSNQALDQGILTESGGDIRIFSRDSVTLGTSRIFTLRGGNEIIWSSLGDIAAGTSSKTVASAPPTRVLIDPQSADLKTDLAGLATGGGIGVLATVEGVKPGDVDLVAPNGAIDAGDAGIRVSGNLNISATQVLNAENIQVTGASVGAPSSVAVAAPVVSVAAPPPPPVSNSATPNPAQDERERKKDQEGKSEEAMSIFSIEILGYGGGDGGTASL